MQTLHTLRKQLHGHSLINYSIIIKMLNPDRVYTSHYHQHHHHHHHHDHYLHSLCEKTSYHVLNHSNHFYWLLMFQVCRYCYHSVLTSTMSISVSPLEICRLEKFAGFEQGFSGLGFLV